MADTQFTLKRKVEDSNISSSSFFGGYEDLGVDTLENNRTIKSHCYLYPDAKVWPLGYGLNTYLYKNKNKKRTMSNDDFNTLPEEIVLKIFKMMDKRSLIKCTLVCHRWRRIAYDESLWPLMNIPCRRLSIFSLDHLLGRNIKYFSASHSNFYVFREQCLFKTPFPKLQYLDLSTVFMSPMTLCSLISQCSNLVKLSLENCKFDSLCCEYIGRNINLKILNLASTVGLDRKGLQHIMSLKSLEELNISWANIEDDGLHYLMANMMPNIKRLNISGFMKQLADFDMVKLSTRCTKLIELDISDSLTITASSLDQILEKNHGLKVLTMNRCYGIESPRLLNPREITRRKINGTMSLDELNIIGLPIMRIFNIAENPDFQLELNVSLYSSIARPKLSKNPFNIWEIPAVIDC